METSCIDPADQCRELRECMRDLVRACWQRQKAEKAQPRGSSSHGAVEAAQGSVNDTAWEDGKSKGTRTEQGDNKGKAAASRVAASADDKDPMRQQQKERLLYRWTCSHTTCAGFGESTNPKQDRVRCQKCSTNFRTSRKTSTTMVRKVFCYSCPECGTGVSSEVANGTVHVSHKSKDGKKCSKQFGVKCGVVVSR